MFVHSLLLFVGAQLCTSNTVYCNAAHSTSDQPGTEYTATHTYGAQTTDPKVKVGVTARGVTAAFATTEVSCFGEEQLITTSTGEQMKIKDARAGDEIVAVDAEGELIITPVLYASGTDVNRRSTIPMICLDTESTTIELTADHIVYAKKAGTSDDSGDDSDDEQFKPFGSKFITVGDQLRVVKWNNNTDDNDDDVLSRATVTIESVTGVRRCGSRPIILITASGTVLVSNVSAHIGVYYIWSPLYDMFYFLSRMWYGWSGDYWNSAAGTETLMSTGKYVHGWYQYWYGQKINDDSNVQYTDNTYNSHKPAEQQQRTVHTPTLPVYRYNATSGTYYTSSSSSSSSSLSSPSLSSVSVPLSTSLSQ